MDPKLMMALLEDIKNSIDKVDRKVDAVRQEVKDDFDEVRDDQKEIHKNLSIYNATQIKQQAILEEHMRRTEANEKALEVVKSEMSPLKTHVAMWGGVAKAVTIFGIIAAAAAAIYKIFS